MAGELYDCHDRVFIERKARASEWCRRYNAVPYSERGKRHAMLRELFGSVGEHVTVGDEFLCGFGDNIYIGEHVSVNIRCVFVDCNRITIGDRVLIAPGVQINTSTHPVELTREFAAALARAAALGEVGLDRLRGPAFPVQQQMLDRLLRLAAEQEKPVVFHCVRATAELLAAVKPYPHMRKLFHGFRGSPELCEELRKHGFYLSLGAAALERAPLVEHLRRTGFDRIGFETDDRPEPIAQLIERAAGVFGCPAEQLAAVTDANFREFLQR